MKIINEMDRCTRDAQDLLLSYLDRLRALICEIGNALGYVRMVRSSTTPKGAEKNDTTTPLK